MCCLNSLVAIKKLKKQMRKAGGTCDFWKVRIQLGPTLCPVFGTGDWAGPGTKHARPTGVDRLLRGTARTRRDVWSGYHVFLSLSDAEEAVYIENNGRIVPVRCNVKDLIAAGRDLNGRSSAVFRKIYLTKKAYRDAVG